MPLYPKKNLLKPVTEWENTNVAAKTVMPTAYKVEFDADVLTYYRNTQISIEKGKPYTISAQYLSDYARVAIREVNDAGAKTFITNITAIYMSHTFTPSSSAAKIEIELTVKSVGYCVFDRIQVEQNPVATPFEPYELGMKKATLLPEKNLIPDFYDSRWFDDNTMAAPTVTVYSDNPYGMRMVITTGAQGRLIWIPVETGKTYTFSFGKATGLYRIYRRKVNNHDNLMALVQNGSPGTPEKFSFTVDESYNGFITIRLTHGSAATLYYENLQLEEGTATQFEPMSLTKTKKVKRIEKINEDMTGAASHIYPYGNVISVKEDVRLWRYQIQVGTPAGTFDSVIYEWNNGAIGEPLFREVVDCNASTTYNLSYKGTLLKAGKKYYIGRNDPNRNNDSTGNAGVHRKTGTPGADFKYITTLGGSQFYSPAIDFPSTWYYTFGLEVEAVNMKKAVGVPKDNLLNPDLSNWEQGSAGGQWEPFGDSTRVRIVKRIPIEPNTQYTIKVRGNYDVYVRQFATENSFETGTSQWNADGAVITTVPTARLAGIIVRKKNNAALTVADISEAMPMMAKGAVNEYKPYELVMKPAILYPKKNYILPFSEWTIDDNVTIKFIEFTSSRVVMDVTVQNAYRGFRMPIDWNIFKQLLGKDVTLSVKEIASTPGLGQLQLRFYGGAGGNVEFVNSGTVSPITKRVSDDSTQAFLVYQLNTVGTLRLVLDSPQLEVGKLSTPYEKYELTAMKPH